MAALGLNQLNASAVGGGKEDVFVEFQKVEIISDGHPQGGFQMKMDKPDKEGVMQFEPCKVKEGTTIALRATMKVFNDTVLGLDFRGNIKWKDMKVVVTEDVRLGSFPPTEELHVVNFMENKMPSGYMSRTKYVGTGQFVDSEDRCHFMMRFTFNLEKDW